MLCKYIYFFDDIISHYVSVFNTIQLIDILFWYLHVLSDTRLKYNLFLIICLFNLIILAYVLVYNNYVMLCVLYACMRIHDCCMFTIYSYTMTFIT